ncbi:unnamed protein product [Trichogramma brassicae]|uniref:Uncharacterized protein n=1 Tax=Trichogramma brassicae TaxID=86971 RepID=A0A6H5J9T0_9HYME|nr:unnamed protein product [Trichogramma brassicae]
MSSQWEDSVNQLRDPTVPDTFEDLCKIPGGGEKRSLSAGYNKYVTTSTQDFAKRTLHTPSDSKASTSKNCRSSNFVQASSSQSPCPVCSEDHALELCATFRKQSTTSCGGAGLRHWLRRPQPWTATRFDNSNEATAEIETPERVALLQEPRGFRATTLQSTAEQLSSRTACSRQPNSPAADELNQPAAEQPCSRQPNSRTAEQPTVRQPNDPRATASPLLPAAWPEPRHQKKKKSTGTPTPKLHGKARRKQRLRELVEQRKKARRDAAEQRERTRSDAAEQPEKALSDAAKQHEKAPSDATEQLTEVMVRDRLHQRALARKTDTPMEVTCAACENETVSVQSIDDAELVLVSADSEVVTLPSTDEKLLNDVQVDAVPVQTTVPPEGPAEAEKLDAVVSLLPWRLIPITPSYRPTSRAVLQRRAEFYENREIIVRQQLRELEAEKRQRLKPEPMVRDIFAERLDVPDEEYNEWLHPTCVSFSDMRF